MPKHLRRYGMLTGLFSLFLVLVLASGLPAVSQSAPVNGLTVAETKSPAVTSPETVGGLTQDVRKTVLENGLTVLTKEVNTAPVVTVQIWYRVGSRNETAGINGIAHQLEHLMFKGTKSRPIQFGRFFSALGSDSNAFTSYDQTAYFGTVEQEKLNALLVLEGDRMQNSLIGDKELASEKRVVISELQGYENNPSYRLGRAVMKAAFPDSPYGLPVGGTKADVQRFTVEQVRDYYRKYYRPDNATLVIVGNFKTEPTLALVKQAFGKVSQGTASLPPLPNSLAPQPSKAAQQKPIVLREPGSAYLLNEVYPLPNAKHADVPALQVMDYILTGGRSSRLYQALVETGFASGAEGYAANLMAGGWYEFSVTAAPGKKLDQIDPVLQKTLADLREKGVTQEELDRAKMQLRAGIILRNREIANQANQLGDDQTTTGDYQYTDRLLAAIAQVSASDVQRVAQTYLAPANRTVGYFEPTELGGKGDSGKFSQTSENFSPGAPVDPAEVAKYLPPLTTGDKHPDQPLPEKLTLANGLQVLLLPARSTPTVTLSGFVQAGTAFDRAATAGLSSLTAANLMNGTTSKNALEIAKTLENRGASLGFGASREGVNIGGHSLSADLPILVGVLADVLKNPSFPQTELELSRQRALTSLKLELDNPARLARRTFQQTIYPASHPFHSFPTEASLTKINRDDVVKFHQQYYQPSSTVLTLVGDFDSAQVRSLLNQELGNWQGSTTDARLTVPAVPLPEKSVRLNPTLPGKAQSVTFLGYNAIDRKDPRFYTAQVLNQILGGDTLSSRLGTEIRDRLGLTYGIYSTFQAGLTQGPFVISMQTAPEDTDRAVSSTLALLQQIRAKGFTEAEVTAAKRSLTSSYPVDLADPDSLAGAILMNAVYGLSINEIRQYPNQINAVTLAQVNQTVKELLHPDRMIIVTAGPPASSTVKK